MTKELALEGPRGLSQFRSPSVVASAGGSKSALGTRTTGNANLAGGHHQKFTELEIVSVFLQHGIELVDLGLQWGSREPKENDAGVGESLLEDKLAKIAVSNDQDPSLSSCDVEDVLIRKTMRIMTRDDMNVMSKLTKVRNKSKVGALVEQEFHKTASDRVPFTGFGETSSPLTIAFA